MLKVHMFFILVFLLITAQSIALAQISFEKTFSGASVGGAKGVKQTSDGGYIIVGTVGSYPEEDIYLIKTDPYGDTLWTKSYGTAIATDVGSSVQQTTDGGYIVVGTSFIYDPYYTQYHTQLIKTDSNGEILWEKEYIGLNQQDNIYCKDVLQTTEGGFVIIGGRNGDVYLIKTNSSGDTLWTKTYYHIRGGLLEGATGNFIQQTSDYGFIITGTMVYTQSVAAFLLKIDSQGDTLWTRWYGEEGLSVEQTSDGGYILATGGGIWGFPFPTALPNIYKTNADGDLLWYKAFSDTLSNVNIRSVQQTIDGGYILAGSIGSVPCLIKTNSSGDTLWTRKYGSVTYDENISVQQTSDNGYIVAGNFNPGGIQGLVLIKTIPDGNIVSIEKNPSNPNSYFLDQNYPNPFNPSTTIKYSILNLTKVVLTVFNLLGEEISTLVNEDKPAGNYSVKFDGASLPSGIYFYRIIAGNFIQTKKMVLLK